MDTQTAKLIKQGAEARIYEMTFLDKPCIVKERFRKSYRHPILDKKLTSKRVAQEARLLIRCKKCGIDTPLVYLVDQIQNLIYMERIQGKTVRDFIFEDEGLERIELARQIGEALAKMHDSDIIHGDLTTSNMIVRESEEIAMIDFGLSYMSSMAEDKAVDLYVLQRALISTHPNSQPLFDTILSHYRQKSLQAPTVLRQLDDVALRGRKRSMVG